MKDQIRNLIIGISSFVIFLFLVPTIFVKALKEPDFTFERFYNGQKAFNESISEEDLSSIRKNIEDFIDKVKSSNSADDIKMTVFEVLPSTKSDTSYVKSSDKQIKKIAEKVIEEAYNYYGTKDVKLLNTVYAVDEKLAAYMEIPQSYLFFALTEDQENMVAYVASYNNEVLEIKPLWDRDKANDSDYVKKGTEKLLYVFSIKLF